MEREGKEYKGSAITVRFERSRCTHVAECIRRLPAVFDMQRRPWVEPDAASADEVAAVVLRCPTGALHFERHDGGPAEQPPEINTVTVAEYGPLYVHGDVEVLDEGGVAVLRDTRVGLCRCGASANPPLCDDSHFAIGWDDCSRVDGIPADPGATGRGHLQIWPQKAGPLTIMGSFVLQDSCGNTVLVRDRSLCRCGKSRTKPLCDGAHLAVTRDNGR
ncbi:MAG: CDGSH iron-sulfur domain-containing protein [Thermoanaerobaculaceae bacterium]|nr:CDGSH iron-sulfur domain-containing protein [Thermoanaerobaculaceae bacterium]MDI9621880.1 CDGSH iron-sulfur domain-containing protein [Acidobacteriota bacterium]NLH10485.1 hypothetical protein [Holophagae bacterium]HPW55366.1 CDGSH iron-sulfur domain-containing protein [Thermoanaerobaculaceae bacterium]